MAAMDCLGLCLEWEQCSELRDRLRKDKRFVVHQVDEEFCVPSRVNAIANRTILLPVLTRLSRTDKFRLPHLEDLKIEIHTMLEKCGVTPGDKLVYSSSVEVKRLAGLVKRRAQRKEVTKDLGDSKRLSFIQKQCTI